MSHFDDLLAYPAQYIVHWPNQDAYVCVRHKEALERIAAAMGLHVSWTGLTEAAVCTNCKNEAEKNA